MSHYLSIKNYYSQIIILVLGALIAQLIGHYYYSKLLVFNRYFLGLWVVMRIVFPLIIVTVFLKIPLRNTGLAVPVIDKNMKRFLLVCVISLILFFIVLYFLGDSYYQNYINSFRSKTVYGRIQKFALFTASTIPGWEFLHRGYLLFGLVYILTEREEMDMRMATIIAILFVTVFESMFHFKKPILESAGFIFGSGILSYIALRTRSILIPFIIHLIIEGLFIIGVV